MKAVFLAVLIVFFASGCTVQDDSDLNLLMRDDPGFRDLVEMKRQMGDQMAQLKSDIDTRKQALNERIKALRQQHQGEIDARSDQIEKLNSQQSRIRDEFKADLDKTESVLAAKKSRRDDLQSALAHYQGILDKKETLGLPAQEEGQWRARVNEIERQLKPLQGQIDSIEQAAYLKRKKVKYL